MIKEVSIDEVYSYGGQARMARYQIRGFEKSGYEACEVEIPETSNAKSYYMTLRRMLKTFKSNTKVRISKGKLYLIRGEDY